MEYTAIQWIINVLLETERRQSREAKDTKTSMKNKEFVSGIKFLQFKSSFHNKMIKIRQAQLDKHILAVMLDQRSAFLAI